MTAEYWIWLQQVLGYSHEAVSRVIAAYGTAESFYKADDMEKIKRCRLTKAQAARLHTVPRKVIYNILKDCSDNGIRTITPEDAEYPERLLNIPDPPAVLYVKGKRIDFNNTPSIAIVGPRKISDYGLKCAYVIANSLASCGFTVVSGGAVGGDSAAHKGAIDAEGVTVAVLGSGIESDYLKTNAPLRERISQCGCLVSEYPPKLGVLKGAFPRRNRIMSGLSNGVAVMEGSLESGTMITARHAVEQGRDVFAIPGSPSLTRYEGTNRLIADGARPLLSTNDIINEYLFLYPDKIHEPTVKATVSDSVKEIKKIEIPNAESVEEATQNEVRQTAKPDRAMLSDEADAVYEVFLKCSDSFTADDAVDKVSYDAGTVIGAVTELEICGFIKALPGGRYRLI